MMVEVFDGKPQQVKRELNEWFTENPGIGIEFVVPCVEHGVLYITVIYTPGFYSDRDGVNFAGATA